MGSVSGNITTMDVAFATDPAAGGPNEDHVVASDSFAVVIDGVTRLPGLDNGCAHDPVWLVHTLGTQLTELLSSAKHAPLPDVLAEAILRLRACHEGGCDLTNPDSPSATVAIARERDEYVDYLVLCDSTVVLDGYDSCQAVTDDRTARLPAYDRESVAKLRNAPDGFWVVSTVPEAAGHALTGSVPRQSLRQVVLCTDGLSRLVERFDRTWPDVLAILKHRGPRGAVEAVRAAERAHPEAHRHGKAHDDATVAVCRIDARNPRHGAG
jgi:serine/threonine protein phosphatase PrpC